MQDSLSSPILAPAMTARSLLPEQRGVETVLVQNLLAVIREDVRRQRGSRPRRGAGFQQGQSIFRADGELTRQFDHAAIRQLALKRLVVSAVSKKQIGSVFGDMPGIDILIRWRLRRGWGPPVSLMAFPSSR